MMDIENGMCLTCTRNVLDSRLSDLSICDFFLGNLPRQQCSKTIAELKTWIRKIMPVSMDVCAMHNLRNRF